ncbi:hypothetical protein ACFL3V_01980 [Nanoarchaeota archaeon]
MIGKKISWCGLAGILVLAGLVIASNDPGVIDVDLGWYDVSDWEIDFCSSWGGTRDEQQSMGGETSSTAMHDITSLDYTATLQAEVIILEEGEDILPADTKVYAISWYLQPVAESLQYEIIAYYDDGTTWLVESASATPFTGYDGYAAVESNETMTKAVMSVSAKSLVLEAIFVE